MKNYNYCNCHK